MNELTFDPNAFLAATTTESLDTRYIPIPIGEYPAIINQLAVRKQVNPKDQTETWTILDITYALDDAGVREATGLDNPTIRQSIFLDIDAGGDIDTAKGKNINLGRLREALGLNTPGAEFSLSMLNGQACIVGTTQNPNAKDPDSPYSNVAKVGALT